MDSAATGVMFEQHLAEGTLVSDKYRIEGLIAAGGMGLVYRAWQPLIARTVALKMVRPELLPQSDAAARFWNEARVLAQLETEHVCRVLDGGKCDGGVPYLVLEHLEGADLRTLLNNGARFTVPRLVDLMLQLLEALAETHAMGIVHRDVKPENLFVIQPRGRSESIKLLDFGICHAKTQARQSTDSVESLGSPQYMPPEQIATPSVIDERGDIWAVGVVMYELLTGHVPFDGDNLTVICAQVFGREPTSIRASRPDVPEELERVILRCLAKDPAERFADVAELSAALAPFGSDAARLSQRRVEQTLGPPEPDPLALPVIEEDFPVIEEEEPVIEEEPAELASPRVPTPPRRIGVPEAAFVDSPANLEACAPRITTVVARRHRRTMPRALAALAAGGLCVAAVNAQPLSERFLRDVAKHALAEAPHQVQVAVQSASVEIQAVLERYEAWLPASEPANVATRSEN